MDYNNILAVVLAGGKSKRFGRDKSQVKLGNKRLIDYILNEIKDLYNDILIVTNEPIKFLDSNKISIISDIKKDLGPLGGVFSAMKWARDNKKEYKWISTFPIDTPFFKKEHLIKNIMDNVASYFCCIKATNDSNKIIKKNSIGIQKSNSSTMLSLLTN